MRLPLALAAASPDRTLVANQLTFKFGNAGENTENEATVRGAGIHTLVNRDEFDAQCSKLFQAVDQLSKASSKTVVAVDDDSVHEALPAGGPSIGRELAAVPAFRLIPLSTNSSTI